MTKHEEGLIAAARPLSELVTYQRGSVVSRALIQRQTGNVTLFAFDEGQQLSEHTSPYDALVQIVEGEGQIRIGGTEHTVHAGCVILLPANVPHAVLARVPCKMLLTMIRG